MVFALPNQFTRYHHAYVQLHQTAQKPRLLLAEDIPGVKAEEDPGRVAHPDDVELIDVEEDSDAEESDQS